MKLEREEAAMTKTILLAEDDPGHEALIRRALKRAGVECDVIVVRDGVEVLDFIFATGSHAGRNQADMPSLILLDLKMPRMDGLQVLQVLRRVRGDQRTSLPPVVVLTSSSEDLDVVNAYQLGAHSFIHKPVDFDKLTDMIGQVAEYWLTLNESPQTGRTVSAVPGSKYRTKFVFEERPLGSREPD
jgi:two-component system, response regulator